MDARRVVGPPPLAGLWPAAAARAAPLALLALAAAGCEGAPAPRPEPAPWPGAPRCPGEMALIDGRFCVDRHEAALERVDEAGNALGLHPHSRPVAGQRVRAVSSAGLLPQGYISRDEAAAACELAGKRLCAADEWVRACQGPEPQDYPYGPRFRSGLCNDEGVSPLRLLHGMSYAHDHATMNDPRLDEVPGTVARGGHFARCTAGEGVFDMVGNLHEWTAGPSAFHGGYFLDTRLLGRGCRYVAVGHAPSYRDYSTGFRCCKAPGAGP